jgi:hypothetical protein
MKLALGLFHFNPYWNLDNRSAHRHCTESLAPLLRAVAAHPAWKLNIEMAGIGLEFVNRAYRAEMELLKELIHRGQVELISSLYTPNIWIAFPGRDLHKSVELNRLCLEELGLPWCRVFFAQEGFFGAGVSTLTEHFDVAVCKDDYLSYYYDLTFGAPCFRLDRMKVILASSHALYELGEALANDPAFARRRGLLHTHRQHLMRASELNRAENFPSAQGECDGTAWRWYHCGDGNHFGTMYKPDELERCYYDPLWSSMFERQMESYEDLGYSFATIGEFAARFDLNDAPEMPPLVDGAWNPRLSDGVFRWMGSNDTAWENDAALLASISRARSRLVAVEHQCPGHPALKQIWKSLLQAQISDALGWFAGPDAISYSLRASDDVLLAATRLLGRADGPRLQMPEVLLFDTEPPEIEITGEGSGGYTTAGDGIAIYDCEFRAVERLSGIRLPFRMESLVFCPSGIDRSAISVPRNLLKPARVSLPLANGLIQIAPGLFLIKDLGCVHVAGIVDFENARLEFLVRDNALGKRYHWRFYVVSASLEHAVDFACTVNVI